VIDGIPNVSEKLRTAGKKTFFVTNISTKSPSGYKKKFDSLGLNVPTQEIFSSSFAAAAYLEQAQFKETGKKVYIIGEIGICEELDLIGVPWIGGPQDKDKVPSSLYVKKKSDTSDSAITVSVCQSHATTRDWTSSSSGRVDHISLSRLPLRTEVPVRRHTWTTNLQLEYGRPPAQLQLRSWPSALCGAHMHSYS
jgi:ribonucleotide monophosphatase NagD (HAD superfamily)